MRWFTLDCFWPAVGGVWERRGLSSSWSLPPISSTPTGFVHWGPLFFVSLDPLCGCQPPKPSPAQTPIRSKCLRYIPRTGTELDESNSKLFIDCARCYTLTKQWSLQNIHSSFFLFRNSWEKKTLICGEVFGVCLFVPVDLDGCQEKMLSREGKRMHRKGMNA